MGNDGPGAGIDLQNRVTARASDFERAGMLSHLRRNDTPKAEAALQAQGKDFEQVKHFPTQEEYGDNHGANGQYFPEGHAITIGLETFDDQAQNIESGEAEDECPEKVIGVALFRGLKERSHAKRYQRRRRQF